MLPYKVLIVDDDNGFTNTVFSALKDFCVESSCTIEDAKLKLHIGFNVVLLDLVFDENQPSRLQGLELIPVLQNFYPDTQIIVMTNHSSTDAIVTSIKLGAKDFLNKKDLDWLEWKNRIYNYCKESYTIKKLKETSHELESKYDDTEIIGISKKIEIVRRQLKDLAQNNSDITIFLSGETGTGKNLAVKYFRKHSVRKDKPFKELSISELSETVLESELFGHVKGAFTGADREKIGLFKEADGGILFLDEIGDYDLKIQKKIMRFIENKTITPVGGTKEIKLDVQLIVATNCNLPKLISEGKFREDLYYRINVAKIELPPLRERKEDIRGLIDYFFKHFKEKEKTNLKSISEEIYSALINHEWGGNVRELYYTIQSACAKARFENDVLLQIIHLSGDPFDIKNSKNVLYDDSFENKINILELDTIEKALIKTNGKKSDAAKILNLSLDKLRYRITCIINKNKKYLEDYPAIKSKYFL
ncbi:MAG: sigma-54 dependent transcriptional regulator [bacterium]